ncbi:general substrate transporter [Diaporthe sp. PMI_573]|nr:general substrate transporter [Diaporthaceae sp. PMI_573]
MALLTLGPVASHALILVVAMCNMCILSYDAGMINNLNTVKPFVEHFNLNSDLTGLNSAIVSAGCIFGGPMVGPIVDRWGRKAGLGVASVCIILGVILQASAESVVQLIIGRFIIGFATLITGSVAPMWVMELASPRYRSILSSSTVVSVPFASFLVACIILGTFDKDSDWAWRGVVLLRFVQGIEVLARLHANGDRHNSTVVTQVQEILSALSNEKQSDGGWKELVSPFPNLRRFGIAVLMNIFYQILGGNMILYFSTYVIANLGINDKRTTIMINIFLLLFKACCSVGGIFLIDKIGSRKPLILGTSATIVLLALLAGLSNLSDAHPENSGYAIGAILVVALFLLAVSTSWMLLAYTYPAEILRYSQRAKGVVAAQSIGYAFSFLNLYTAPIAIETIAWRYYAINASWNVGILAVVIWLFVETKGRTLEEMDELFDGTVHRDGLLVGQNSHTKLRQEESIDMGSLPSGSLMMTTTNRS